MNESIKNILRKCRDIGVNIFRVFPINNSVLFESNPDFNDEGYWLCKYLEDKGIEKKYKVYWILKDHSIDKAPNGWNASFIYESPRSLKEFIKRYYVLYTVKFIFDSCSYTYKKRKKQVRIHIIHGMPIKNADEYYRKVGNADYVEIGSSFFSKYFSDAGVEKSRQLNFGLIRNDALGYPKEYLNKIGINKKEYKKVVMWLPTYRQRSDHQDICSIEVKGSSGLPILYNQNDTEVLNHRLQDDQILLIIKPHQSQDLETLHINTASNILVLTNEMLTRTEVQLYSLLSEVDALITDYSSVYFDFLLADKPIGLTVDDLNEYRDSVGFAFAHYENASYEKNIAGEYLRTLPEFLSFFDNLLDTDKVKAMVEKLQKAKLLYNDEITFHSGDKFYDFLVRKLNF